MLLNPVLSESYTIIPSRCLTYIDVGNNPLFVDHEFSGPVSAIYLYCVHFNCTSSRCYYNTRTPDLIV